jgi:Spy/CpxP family protein refolding chaperone
MKGIAMESPKKITLQSAIIAILVLLNVCTIAFFLLGPKPFPPPRCEERKEQAMMPAPMEKELGFSEEQRSKFAEMQKAFGSASDSLRLVMEKANQELFELTNAEKVDQEVVRQKISSLAVAETVEKWQAFKFGRALRDLCTADQRKKLESFPPDPIKNMHKGPGMPPRPQPHGGPVPAWH